MLAIVGILAVWMLQGLKPTTQIGKAKDAKRKEDLKRVQTVLEDYYNDHNCYPPSLNCGDPFLPYLTKIPCDPDGGSYEYDVPEGVCPRFYRIYTKLSYLLDPDIEKIGCQAGCGPGSVYNYGLSSSNVGLEVGTPVSPTSTIAPPLPTTTSPPLGQYYGCFSGKCKPIPGPICVPNYQQENCFGACSNPLNECK